MALSGIQRTFAGVLNSIWGKNAQTTIPTQPVSGIAYRDTDAEFESGQKYDSLGESSRWNQLLYLLSGLSEECSRFGILPWSSAQPYNKGALCIGPDGSLWLRSLLPSILRTRSRPARIRRYGMFLSSRGKRPEGIRLPAR